MVFGSPLWQSVCEANGATAGLEAVGMLMPPMGRVQARTTGT